MWLAEAAKDDVLLDLHEYYEKQTARNRYEILGVNGKLSLTIPVLGQKGEKVMTKDIRIANHDWCNVHLRSIRSAYGRAPFYEFYFEEVEKIIRQRHTFLLDFNMDVLQWLRSKKLLITTEITQEFHPYGSKEIVSIAMLESDPTYPQVFSDRYEFVRGLSAIDLLMNLGPRCSDYILLWKNGK